MLITLQDTSVRHLWIYSIPLPFAILIGGKHQAKDIVVAPAEPIFYCQRQLFCFVAFLVCQRADQTGGEVQAGKLACMDEHHHLAARA